MESVISIPNLASCLAGAEELAKCHHKSSTSRKSNELQRYNCFYGSKLVKMSARQYTYVLHKQTEYTATQDMNLGNVVADRVLGSDSNILQEVGNSVQVTTSYNVVFNLDGAKLEGNTLHCYEHKYLFKGEPDDWKVQASAAQLLLYGSLASQCKKLQSGNYTGRSEVLELPEKFDVVLHLVITLPDKVMLWSHKLTTKDFTKVISFYSQKANSIYEGVIEMDWSYVDAWDGKYKHKEHLEFFPNLTINDFKQIA